MKIPVTSLMTPLARRVPPISYSCGATIMGGHCLAALFLMLAAGLITPCRANNLYVSNSDNHIEKFTAGGAGSRFAHTPLKRPPQPPLYNTGRLFPANTPRHTRQKDTPRRAGSALRRNLCT